MELKWKIHIIQEVELPLCQDHNHFKEDLIRKMELFKQKEFMNGKIMEEEREK